MGDNFNYDKYKGKIKSLTERAKKNDVYKDDIDIGELFYIEMLKKYIMEFRSGSIDTSALEGEVQSFIYQGRYIVNREHHQHDKSRRLLLWAW